MVDEYDKELTNILEKYFGATLKEVPSAGYNVFLTSSKVKSLARIAEMLTRLKIDFSYEWNDYEDDPEEEIHEGTIILAAVHLKELKPELRGFLFDE